MTLSHAPSADTRSSTKRLSVESKRCLTSLQTETDPSGKNLQRLQAHAGGSQFSMAWVDGCPLKEAMETVAEKSYKHGDDLGFT